MAAGLGTRLRPLTDRVTKCLVPIGGRPLLDYWCDRIAAAGLSDVLINTHHLPEQVRAYIASVNAEGRSGGRFAMREAYEPKLLGSAGTVHANRSWADDADRVLIIYSDNLSGVDLTELLRFHASHPDPVTMLLFRTENPQRCGIAEMDAANRITAFIEKPERPRSNLANGGIYVVDAAAYGQMADMAAFDLAFDVLPRFVGRMRGWVWDGYHLDIGTHESLARAEQDLAADCLRPGYRRIVNWSPAA
jgi:NDP-sugar pyrophosphorylase family protein